MMSPEIDNIIYIRKNNKLKIGDVVKVKVTEIDSQNRINLSRKELLK